MPSASPRIVITGMGWITPLGHTIDRAWSRLTAGEVAIGPVSRFDASSFTTNFAAEVKGFDLPDHLPAALARRHAQAGVGTQMALAAATQAWTQAGLGGPGEPIRGAEPRRVGLYLGGGEGSLDYDAFWATNLGGRDADNRRALWDRLQFSLDGEPDHWFEHDKAALDQRQFTRLVPELVVTHVNLNLGAVDIDDVRTNLIEEVTVVADH
mgnify:FL=1